MKDIAILCLLLSFGVFLSSEARDTLPVKHFMAETNRFSIGTCSNMIVMRPCTQSGSPATDDKFSPASYWRGPTHVSGSGSGSGSGAKTVSGFSSGSGTGSRTIDRLSPASYWRGEPGGGSDSGAK